MSKRKKESASSLAGAEMSRDVSRRSQSNQNNNSALRNQKTREDFYKNVNNLLTAATTSIQLQKPNS